MSLPLDELCDYYLRQYPVYSTREAALAAQEENHDESWNKTSV